MIVEFKGKQYKLVLTDHAKERMKERGIDFGDLKLSI